MPGAGIYIYFTIHFIDKHQNLRYNKTIKEREGKAMKFEVKKVNNLWYTICTYSNGEQRMASFTTKRAALHAAESWKGYVKDRV